MTTYIDLREEGQRTPIPALVKGCRREHALEDGETILVSKPARFRQYGEALIRDVQEAIRPKGEDWDRWSATLPDDYDHVSEIGQPAKFAEALARMVTEQIAAHGSDARLRITTDSGHGSRC